VGAVRIALWAGLLGVLTWELVRGLGLDRGTPLVQLVSYTPYLAVAAAVLLVVALVLRRWWEVVVAVLAVAVCAAFVVPRTVAADDSAAGVKLTVLSANVYHGRADGDDRPRAGLRTGRGQRFPGP